jgi:hypothetical protein
MSVHVVRSRMMAVRSKSGAHRLRMPLDAPAKPEKARGAPRRYRRPPMPVSFPADAEVPETKDHLELRTALYQLVKGAFSEAAWIGSAQFVYWDPTDPKQCIAPDLFVRLGGPDESFDVWQVWKRGAPELAVEIASRSDVLDEPWERKLERYRHLGVEELVRFDSTAADDPHRAPEALRVWDGIDGDLVERELDNPCIADCGPLVAYWVIRQHPQLGPVLRLARDAQGRDLFDTSDEAERHKRQVIEHERDALVERVRELEAELHRDKRSP